MGKVVIFFFISACSFLHLPNKKNDLNKSLIGWWERFYPDDSQSNNKWNLTHIEFMDDGECRYNIGYYEGDKYYDATYNSNKWVIDSVITSNVLVTVPSGLGQNFIISVIDVNKSNLVFILTFPNFSDTIHMKKLAKLH